MRHMLWMLATIITLLIICAGLILFLWQRWSIADILGTFGIAALFLCKAHRMIQKTAVHEPPHRRQHRPHAL